ncbi:EpsG family protein [TM7 phylum sp. oral taxon 349]|jgi:putative polysaccharide polymerase|nr:EpsG family protein [TM7 phylum sp. oral taxon 349]
MGKIASLVLYLSVFCLSSALFGYGVYRKNKVMKWAGIIPPLLLASLRYGVGTDYGTYESLFNQFSRGSLADYLQDSSSAEPGFYILVQISNFLTGDSVPMFAIAAALSLIFFHLGLNRYNIKHPALVYFLYLMVLFPMTLNLVRQGIAVSIVFYALSFFIERDFKKYLVFMIIAGLFHISAFILLPVYLLNRLTKTKYKNVYLTFLPKLVTVAGCILIFIPFFSSLVMQMPAFSKYGMYTVNAGEGTNYTLLLQIVILISGTILIRRLINDSNRKLYTAIIIFATLEVVFGTIGYSSTFIKRIGLYFSIFGFMLFVESMSMFRNRGGKILLSCFIIGYGVAYFTIAYYALGQSDLFPYKLIVRGLSI